MEDYCSLLLIKEKYLFARVLKAMIVSKSGKGNKVLSKLNDWHWWQRLEQENIWFLSRISKIRKPTDSLTPIFSITAFKFSCLLDAFLILLTPWGWTNIHKVCGRLNKNVTSVFNFEIYVSIQKNTNMNIIEGIILCHKGCYFYYLNLHKSHKSNFMDTS